MLKDIIKGGSLILLSVVFSKLFSILYIPILARILGPNGFGLYNLALTMLPWFVNLISLSLSTIVAQTIAENSKNKERLSIIVTTYLFFTLLLSLFGGLLHLFFAKTIALEFFKSSELVHYLRLVSGGVALAIFYNTIVGIARGLKDFNLYFQMEVFKSFIYVVLGLLFLLFFRYGVQGALLAIILSPIIPIVYLLIKHRQYLGTTLRLNVIFSRLHTVLWVTLISLFLTFLVTADRFFLGIYADPEAIGFYASVMAVVMAISLIASSFKGSILPFISEHFEHHEEIRLTVQRIVSYTLMLTSFILFFFVTFRKEIILVLFGEEFLPALTIVPILGLTLIPFTIYILTHTIILDRRMIAHATKMLFPVTLVALFVDWMLIKRFSVMGAGLGLFISHSLVASTYLQILRTKFKLPLRRVLGLSLLIIVGVGLALLLPSSLFYRIPLSFLLLLVYLGILWGFKFITKREVDITIRIVKLYLRRLKSL